MGSSFGEGEKLSPLPSPVSSAQEAGEIAYIPESKQGASGGVSTRVEKPAPVRVLGREEWERAWAAYLSKPSMKAVQDAVPCSPDVARRLLHEGVPALGLPGLEGKRKEEARLAMMADKRLRAGTEKLDAETAAQQLEARREAAAAMVAKEKAVLGDAVSQAEEEAQLVRANRKSAMVLAGIQSKLLRSTSRLVTHLDTMLEEVEVKGLKGKAALDELGLKPMQALALARGVATVAQKTAEVSRQAVEMERLITGKPTSIVESQTRDMDMSPEDAAMWVARAARAYERGMKRNAVLSREELPGQVTRMAPRAQEQEEEEADA